jgi:hypothetical protein
MVNTLMRRFRRWLAAARQELTRMFRRYWPWQEDQEDESPRRFKAPSRLGIAPAAFEMLFMRLHAEGRFDEMWDMIADDAQQAWGDRDTFVREVQGLDDGTELLDIEVLNVQVLDMWTDRRHDRTYSNVAQVMLRYRMREQWKDWSLDREVHLVPGTGGWRTLFYPAQMKSGAGSR